ncbi:MAG: DUF4430 domain-containing protein [Oscillospiraceae bacterium]|nr:DUF4430 domain-containing protein [Oscillospiraceae bacterium]
MKKAKFILSTLLVVLIAVGTLSGCEDNKKEIAISEVTFTFEMTDEDGETSEWLITTQETTVGAALLAEGLIEGNEGAFGLMVSHVNGIRADWDMDKAYWAFYINGDYAMSGVGETQIEQGVTYAFVYTKS